MGVIWGLRWWVGCWIKWKLFLHEHIAGGCGLVTTKLSKCIEITGFDVGWVAGLSR